MSNTSAIIALSLLSYLVGSIPFGLLIARLRKIDLRSSGSGNIGATNVFRTVGKSWGILTLALDALKGGLPAAYFPLALPSSAWDPSHLGLLFGLLAIAGHTWPVYLRFHGGKGVATSAGVLIALAPAVMGVGFLIFAALLAATGYVSVASMGAAVAATVAGWVLHRQDGLALPMALTCLAALILWRHRANIQRLLRGEENRLVRKK